MGYFLMQIKIAKALHSVHSVSLHQIALITPYSAQKMKLMTLAMEAGMTLTGPKKLTIATITECQGTCMYYNEFSCIITNCTCLTGDEYGIVILSTVRSQPLTEIGNEEHVQPDRAWLFEHLGFLTDEHEINVAITRSKYGLIIVGM